MKKRLLYLFFLIAVGVYAYLQISTFLNIPEPFQEPDSIEFLSPEATPYAWGGAKHPFVPFIYKLLGRDIELIPAAQLLFSMFSWTFLAYVLARSVRTIWIAPVMFISILAFSLSAPVSMWNKSILAESISLSLIACFVGSWILFIDGITLKRLTLLIIMSIMFTLARTANIFMALTLSIIIFTAFLLNRQPIQRRYYLAISIVFLILFIGSNAIANRDNHWAAYFLNVLSKRVLVNQEMRTYFEEHGMPVNDSLMARADKWSHDDDFAYYKDPNLEQFREWLYIKGKATYIRYLLTHPKYLIAKPLPDLHRMMFSGQVPYYAPKGFKSPLQHRLFDYLSSWSLYPVYVFLSGVLFGLNLIYATSKKFTAAWVPLIMMLLVIPFANLTWHADALEIERHVLPVAIQARLGFIILFFFAVDVTLSEHVPNSRKGKV